MKYLLSLLLLLPGLACANGNLCLSQTSGSYSFSNSAAWTNCGGTHPGDGDFVVWRSPGKLTIDLDLGTSSVGIKTVRIENGTVAGDKLTPHNVYFASTGTNPIGSGTFYNPGADATIHGFFVAGPGVLDLEGTPTTLLNITVVTGGTNWYISRPYGGVTGCTAYTSNVCNGVQQYTIAGAITVKYATLANLGSRNSSPYFEGVYGYNYNTTLVVANCKFVSPYRAVSSDGNGISITFTANHVTGRRSNATIYQQGNPAILIVTDNTEDTPVANGTLLSTIFEPQATSVVARNAVMGTPTYQIGGILYLVYATTSPYTVSDTLCYNYPIPGITEDCVSVVFNAASAVTGVVSEGAYQTVVVKTSGVTFPAAATVSNSIGIQGTESVNSQGIFYLMAGNAIFTNVVAYYPITVNYGITLANISQSNSALTIDHVVSISKSVAGGANSGGINIGEAGATLINNVVRSSIAMNGSYCIYDGGVGDTYVQDYERAGLHHNSTYGCTINYYKPSTNPPSHFDNGSYLHPSAVYRDIDGTNPMLLDWTRRMAGWDALVGGPGTITDLFANLARRDGIEGAYTIPISSNPIASIRNWMMQGFQSTSLSLKGAATSGGDIGAVPMMIYNTPGGVH